MHVNATWGLEPAVFEISKNLGKTHFLLLANTETQGKGGAKEAGGQKGVQGGQKGVCPNFDEYHERFGEMHRE